MGKIIVYVCLRSDLMNTEKRDFDKAATTWDEKPARIKLAGDIAGALSEEVTLTSDTDVLDFGCGTGLLTLRLQPLVRSVTGVDSSQGMLDVLKAKTEQQNLPNVKTQCLEIDKGDVLEGRYDVIVSSMTFHHIREIRPFLDQFYKALTPGGFVCVADLDPDDGQFHQGNNEGVFHFGFDRAALRKVFMEAGFHDVRDRTAAEVVRSTSDGEMRRFTVFLMIGRKH